MGNNIQCCFAYLIISIITCLNACQPPLTTREKPSLIGILRYPHGSPIEQISAKLFNSSGEIIEEAITNQEGEFTFTKHLNIGKYTLQFMIDNSVIHTENIILNKEDTLFRTAHLEKSRVALVNQFLAKHPVDCLIPMQQSYRCRGIPSKEKDEFPLRVKVFDSRQYPLEEADVEVTPLDENLYPLYPQIEESTHILTNKKGEALFQARVRGFLINRNSFSVLRIKVEKTGYTPQVVMGYWRDSQLQEQMLSFGGPQNCCTNNIQAPAITYFPELGQPQPSPQHAAIKLEMELFDEKGVPLNRDVSIKLRNLEATNFKYNGTAKIENSRNLIAVIPQEVLVEVRVYQPNYIPYSALVKAKDQAHLVFGPINPRLEKPIQNIQSESPLYYRPSGIGMVNETELIPKTTISVQPFDRKGNSLVGATISITSLTPEVNFTTKQISGAKHSVFTEVPTGTVLKITINKDGYKEQSEILIVKRTGKDTFSPQNIYFGNPDTDRSNSIYFSALEK